MPKSCKVSWIIHALPTPPAPLPLTPCSTLRLSPMRQGQTDYPCYWSSTTHANRSEVSGGFGAYVAFGRAMGYMNGTWIDVHGAGAQRSDPKSGDPDVWPTGHGPQGDAIRIYNYARLVCDARGTQSAIAY